MNFIAFILSKFWTNVFLENRLSYNTTKFDTEQISLKFLLEIMTLFVIGK